MGTGMSKTDEISGVNFSTATLYNPSTTSPDSAHGYAGMSEKNVRAIAGRGQNWQDSFVREIDAFSFSTETVSLVTTPSRDFLHSLSGDTTSAYGVPTTFSGNQGFSTSTYGVYGGGRTQNPGGYGFWLDKLIFSTNTIAVLNDNVLSGTFNGNDMNNVGSNGTLGFLGFGNYASSYYGTYTFDLSNGAFTSRTASGGTTFGRMTTSTPTKVYMGCGLYQAGAGNFQFPTVISRYSFVDFTLSNTSASSHSSQSGMGLYPNFL